MYQVIYKCRLCNKVFTKDTATIDGEAASICLTITQRETANTVTWHLCKYDNVVQSRSVKVWRPIGVADLVGATEVQ